MLDYKNFRFLMLTGYFQNKNKKDETNHEVEDYHAPPYLMKCLDIFVVSMRGVARKLAHGLARGSLRLFLG